MAPQLQPQFCKKQQPWTVATEECDQCSQGRCLETQFIASASDSECYSTHIFLFQTIMHKIVWIKIFRTRSFKSDPLLQHWGHPAEMPDQLSINPFRIGFPLHQTTLHEGLYALTKVFHVHTTRWKMLVPASPQCISSCSNITAGSLWKLKNSC